MRTSLVFVLAFLAAACGKDKAADPAAAGKPGDAPADKAAPAAGAKVDYAPIDAQIAAAKTGDDWSKVLVSCGGLEIDAAANGNGKLADDPEFNKHCGVNFEMLRAKQTIEMSTADHMHDTCISSAMGLEGLIAAGKVVDEAKAKLAEVNKACGLTPTP